MALGGEVDFTGKLRLPLPDTFSGNPADWEEWSWNFKAHISMFETGAVTLLDAAEIRNDEFLDEHLAVTWTQVMSMLKQPPPEYFSPESYIIYFLNL